MAGHSQFKNIMHRKGAQDAKRAKLFTKLIKEIVVAAKTGLPDPTSNSRLRTAMAAARAQNVPKDRIDKAIKNATSEAGGENYEEIRYEGYAPGGVAIIVEAATDNRNRTASEVRSIFTKNGGNLGESGSVSFMFDRLGLIEYPASLASADEMLDATIEAGADDCISDEFCHQITCQPDSLHEVREKLAAKFGDPNVCRLTWEPQNTIDVSGEQAEKLFKLVEILEDNDDVQFVCGNYNVDEETMNKLSA